MNSRRNGNPAHNKRRASDVGHDGCAGARLSGELVGESASPEMIWKNQNEKGLLGNEGEITSMEELAYILIGMMIGVYIGFAITISGADEQ